VPFIALFVWLISHQAAVLFSQNKSATNNQSAVLFSQNKSAPAISHQANEQAACAAIVFCNNVWCSDLTNHLTTPFSMHAVPCETLAPYPLLRVTVSGRID
jgi:hypothetical protein